MDITDNKNDKYLYKYLPLNNYSLMILASDILWLGAPDLLNDPFEGDFIIDNISEFYNDEIIKNIISHNVKSKYSEIVDPQIFKQLKENVDSFTNSVHEFLNNKIKRRFGSTSFSKRCDCPRMWSQYADSHKGFVIVFDKNLLQHSVILSGGTKIIDVQYCGLPHVNLILENNEIYINNEKSLLVSKLGIWKNEEEVRIIKNTDFVSTYPRRLRIDKKCIVGIIYGGRLPFEERLLINNILLPDTTAESYMHNPIMFLTGEKNAMRDGLSFIPIWHNS